MFLQYILPLSYFGSMAGFYYFISLIASGIALAVGGAAALSFVIYKAIRKQKQSGVFLFVAAFFCSAVFLTSQNIFMKKIISLLVFAIASAN
ncbi:MAG: hypothetical protein QME32_01845, partial [Endomicrobiia bacterium]|nr:hypothetical protein [Endomicrobiia bacterium]